MKKIGLICILFTVLATFGVQAEEGDVFERWRCFDPYDYDWNTVLVELTQLTAVGETQGIGQISVAGVTYRAHFQIEGLNKRWNFGEVREVGKGWPYAFVIRPDGLGGYYDFLHIKDNGMAAPRQAFRCVSP